MTEDEKRVRYRRAWLLWKDIYDEAERRVLAERKRRLRVMSNLEQEEDRMLKLLMSEMESAQRLFTLEEWRDFWPSLDGFGEHWGPFTDRVFGPSMIVSETVFPPA